MKSVCHIVNGDSLLQQFPQQIQGEIFVMRECLVDGELSGNRLEELFETRAKFIAGSYDGGSTDQYYQKVVAEFRKMQNIPKNTEINLWFEDDLFCQVNLWFVISLLSAQINNSIYLVRPKTGSEYCFANMSESELIIAYHKKMVIELSDARKLSRLWQLYKVNNCPEMIENAQKLYNKFPFLLPAVEAHIDRLPKDGKPGRDTQSLLCIMDELGTREFRALFQEFSKREGIYGFGDTQVKRLLVEIERNR
jgi:hypothetical protein